MKNNHSQKSGFLRSQALFGLLLLAAAILGLVTFSGFSGRAAQGAASVSTRDSGPLRRVLIKDPELMRLLKTQGASEVVDYGNFVLVDVNEAAAINLSNNPAVDVLEENNLILLNAGTIDTSAPEVRASRGLTSDKVGKQMRLIQFVGPIRPEWYDALVGTGVQIVTYIPSNTYLVYGTSQALAAAQAFAAHAPMVQWDGEYTAASRLDPTVTNNSMARIVNNLSAMGNDQFAIQLVDDPAENEATLALIDQFKLEPIIKQDRILGYVNVMVALPKDVIINQIADRGDVVSIQPWSTPALNCERQDIILTGNISGNPAVPTPSDYLAYLTGKGFSLGTAATFGVNVSDTGLDNGTTTPFQFLLYTLGDATNAANSRVSYVTAQGSAVAGDLPGCHGHGNLNCTIIGGYVPTGTSGGVNFAAFPHADPSGFRWGLGVAPFVKVGLSVIFKTNGTFTNPSYSNLESQAYQAGMRISSNSWGAPVGGVYNTDSQAYDSLVRDAQPAGSTFPTAGNQEYTIVFSAGNDGSGASTIGSPGTAKNVITVGAAENVNPFGGTDGSGIADSGANNANDIISFSSRGPCTDLRKKPDIMGPGTHVSGGAPQNAANPGRTGNGTVLACFTGAGVSGGVSPNKFFPVGQQWYTASSGTSHSCPAAAGAAALFRQQFINQSLTPPSPAMIKALMMNSARYMTGTGANDSLPSNNQGMGEISLNNFFDTFATGHVFHDQTAADLITATGQVRTVTGTVSTAAKPFRVTLAWTDTPGPTSANAYVNNLDLQVVVGGNTYRGNVFSAVAGNGFSITGGSADPRNNVESVFLPAGVTGPFTITVTGTNIAGNGVPGNASALDQDFALVVYNGTESSATPTPSPTPSPTPTPTPTPSPAPTPSPSPTPPPVLVASVNLPIGTVSTAVTNFTQTITTSAINGADNLVGFQGDFSFDSAVISFQSVGTSPAGLTASNWNVSSNILNIGPGTIKALRLSAFSNDFTPLSGSGILCNLNMVRISSTPGANSPLIWQADPNNFQFISDVLETSNPGSTPNGSLTISASTVSISGTAIYCSNPSLNPVPGVTMTLTGTTSGSATTDGSGNYSFAGLTSGGNYTVTPTKAALPSGSAGITTVDVVAVQRHFLNIALIPPGCRLTAADVNNSTTVDTSDVIAIQRFALAQTTGLANVGKYNFSPANRTYPGLASNQTSQNYDVLVFGDVASGFVHRPDGTTSDMAQENQIAPTVSTVALPEIAADQSRSIQSAPVTVSMIEAKDRLVGFQGDFTFDERVVSFENVPVQKAGLTAGNWNVSGNVLPGVGPIRTLRVSAYSNDFAPLSGSGTLFELRVKPVGIATGKTPIGWSASPANQFIFIDADLNVQRPFRTH